MNPQVQFDETRRKAVRDLLTNNVRNDTAKVRRRSGRAVAVGVAIAGSLTLGAGAMASTGQLGWITLPCQVAGPCTPTYATVPAWPVNQKGQTYGVQGDSPVPPDLVAVVATNGTKGYVLSRDLEEPQPTSPADAAKNFSTPRPTREIPVFLQDGETKVGTFDAPG